MAKKGDSSFKTKPLQLFATGDVGSDTDVCGCKARRLGGIARRVGQLKARSQGKGSAPLVVDAGDLFYRNWNLSPRYRAQAEATADFHAQILKQQKAAAVAVGERDLALGRDSLQKLAEKAGVSLLSANLVHVKGSTLAFEAFKLVTYGQLKVGLVALSPELSERAQAYQVYARNKLALRDSLESIKEAAEAAKKAGAEFVVGLFHIGERRSTEILGALGPGTIDLVLIAGDRTSRPLSFTPDRKTATLSLGSRGKYLAAIELDVSIPSKGYFDRSAVQEQEKIIKQIEGRIAEYQAELKAKDMIEAVRKDRQATIRRLEQRKQKMSEELMQLDSKGKHIISAELIPLDLSLEDDPDTLKLYQKYQDSLHQINRGVPTANRAELKYLGSKACKSCHLPAYKFWQKSKHARAWQTMIDTRQTANLDCIACHTTGFDRPGGPKRPFDLGDRRNVGCESCHGPGSAHVKEPKMALDYGKEVPESVCAECHRAQEDQKPFFYEERLQKIIGKGHGK